MAEPSPTPPGERGARRGQVLGRRLAPALYDVRTTGFELVPAQGPLLVVANHSAFLDGPLIYCVFPRPVHFLVKRAYFRGPVGTLLHGVGQIPIVQHSGDRQALTAATVLLQQDGVVGIFPEGTRGSGEVASAQQGAAFLALRTGAQILPVAVSGTRPAGSAKGAWPRPRARLDAVAGEPFRVDTDLSGPGRQRLRDATERLRERLAEHVRTARPQRD